MLGPEESRGTKSVVAQICMTHGEVFNACSLGQFSVCHSFTGVR